MYGESASVRPGNGAPPKAVMRVGRKCGLNTTDVPKQSATLFAVNVNVANNESALVGV